MRPLLVGESNPYGDDSAFALYPMPRGCAGWNLCHRILRMDSMQYIQAFGRVNLLKRGEWSARDARQAAIDLLCARDVVEPLILLGARVAKAFRLPYAPFTFNESTLIAILPHPSGRSRAWNDPQASQRAREAVDRARGIK